eukprot:3860318-Rhodomonas_salina.3
MLSGLRGKLGHPVHEAASQLLDSVRRRWAALFEGPRSTGEGRGGVRGRERGRAGEREGARGRRGAERRAAGSSRIWLRVRVELAACVRASEGNVPSHAEPWPAVARGLALA